MKKTRHQETCVKCHLKFSTHSTNRFICYECKPKCREVHDFDPGYKKMLDDRREAKKKEHDELLNGKLIAFGEVLASVAEQLNAPKN